jgi:hypothetical protein
MKSIISIPLTGTLLSYDPPIGDDNDMVRPVHIDLGNVSWQLVNLDLERDLALIEVTPSDVVYEDTGKYTPEGEPIVNIRKVTDIEKLAILQNLKDFIYSHSAEELYHISGCKPLKKPPANGGQH